MFVLPVLSANCLYMAHANLIVARSVGRVGDNMIHFLTYVNNDSKVHGDNLSPTPGVIAG